MLAKHVHDKANMVKKSLACVAILMCFTPYAFCQLYGVGLSATINKLKTYSDHHIREQTYLHFDKPYYAAGDTLYFTAYITVGDLHQLSALSGVLHVDLIDPGNRIGQSILLQSNGGVCWGDFALPDSLPAGNYRVRAYTQWMRNNGDIDFFDKTIPVGSLVRNDAEDSLVKPMPPDINRKPDIQFFPEGGSLVAGMKTKIAFKAVGTNGLGIEVKGSILDNHNKEMGAFASSHLGMGSFSFSPLQGAAYKAGVVFADGRKDTVSFPMPDSSGIHLTVTDDDTAKAVITVTANPTYYGANRNKDFFLIIYSGGKATTAPFTLDTYVTTLSVITKQLRTGIATVTLFSGEGEPLCERLLFVQNHDPLALHITTDKTTFNKRENVNLAIHASDQSGATVAGHFSVSVIDESIVPEDETDETTILTHLLLTSDLTGYVEQPNYYFTDTGSNLRSNLDVLMLTQGYRRFEWQQVLHNDSSVVAYPPEKALEIDGRVMDLSDNPIGKATITLLPSSGGSVLSSVSDNNGMFRFPDIAFMDTTHFVLSAADSKGRNSTKIAYVTNSHSPSVDSRRQRYRQQTNNGANMSVYLANETQYHRTAAMMDNNKAHLLKEVIVKTKKQDDYRTQSLVGAGHADQVMQADEIEQVGGQLSTSLYGRLRSVSFVNGIPYLKDMQGIMSLGGGGSMLVVIDGVEANLIDKDGRLLPFSLDALPSTQIETIEVLKYTSAGIYGMNGGNGVLVITTKQSEDKSKEVAAVGVLPIVPAGFYKAKVFYSPRYNYANINSKLPDLRSTIYWNPDIKTGKDGNASFDYYNADGTGTYKVVIEGMDDNGNIGRQVYRYTVQ